MLRLKKITLGLVIGVIWVMLLGCQATPENKAPLEDAKEDVGPIVYEPAPGGGLNLPITYVETLNPLLNEEKSLYYFYKLIYESLFEFDENMTIKNKLAKDYRIIDNGRGIEIDLVNNAYWHDGQNFTAEDVKFTIDTLKFGAENVAYSQLLSSAFKMSSPMDLARILNVVVTGENRVKIMFDRPYSHSLESLTFPILPKHQFISQGVNNKEGYQRALNKDFIKSPIGTGPYKFVTYNRLKSIELIANDSWWQTEPYIKNITGKILDNQNLAITAFENGKVDVTLTKGVDWEKYSENQSVEIYEFVTRSYEFLGFNFAKPLFQGELGKIIRYAIAYGIDKQAIISDNYLGHATSVDIPLYPNSWLLFDEAFRYGFNADKARQILESAGFVDKNNDGFYEDPNGKKLSMRLLTNGYNPLRRKTADQIIENLKAVGIEVIPQYPRVNQNEVTQAMEEQEFLDVQQKLYSGQYDMVLLGWELSFIPDLSFMFHSNAIERGMNFISYKNDRLDALLGQAFTAGTREAKKTAYTQIQDIILEDLPYVSLFYKNSSMLTRDRVHGDINPHPFNIYYKIENWFIPEPLQNENKTTDK